MSITIRSTNSGIRYQVRYRNPAGRQASRQFKTKREALAFEAAESVAIQKDEWIDPRAHDFAFDEWAWKWLANDPGKRVTTATRDEIIIRRHLIPELGKRRLRSIVPMDIQRLVNKWSTHLAPHTVHRQYRTLSAIFRAAVINDFVTKSPCRGIKLPRLPKRKAVIVNADDLQRLANELGDHALMAYIGAILGLRWGEVAGLRVCDLDLLNRAITVNQQVSRDKFGGAITSLPKTEAGSRTLSIPVLLVDAFARHLSSRGIDASHGDVLLFPDTNGNPLRYSNWRRRIWKPACLAAGLESLCFHDLRRVNATAMVAAGVDIKTAQSRLGHADPRMTLAIYAQAVSEADIDAASKLGDHFLTNNQDAGSALSLAT